MKTPTPTTPPEALEAVWRALDVADRLIERGYGMDIPAEWNAAWGDAVVARTAWKRRPLPPEPDDGRMMPPLWALGHMPEEWGPLPGVGPNWRWLLDRGYIERNTTPGPHFEKIRITAKGLAILAVRSPGATALKAARYLPAKPPEPADLAGLAELSEREIADAERDLSSPAAGWKDWVVTWADRLIASSRSRVGLESALRNVLRVHPSYAPDGDTPDYKRLLERVHSIVRAALAAKPGHEGEGNDLRRGDGLGG